MIGGWIDIIARRLVRADTFALVVEPAIADLQFEARTRAGWIAARSYIGVWIALGGAVWVDLVGVPRRPGWVEDMTTVAGLVLLQLAYYAGFVSLFSMLRVR